MISIRLVGKERKIVGIVDDNTPVPHTLARISDESADYGLADTARLLYPELVKKKDDEIEGVRQGLKLDAKRAAERARVKETDEEIIINIGDYVESVASDEETDLQPAPLLDPETAALQSAAAYKKAMRGAVAGGGGSGGGGKTNGYCLFIKDIANKKGARGSISELMAKFDKDWRMLPDNERAYWKMRAKSGGSSGYGGRRESSQGTSRGQQERFQPSSAASTLGQEERFQPSGAASNLEPQERFQPSGAATPLLQQERFQPFGAASTLGPRGRGRGRGRGKPVKTELDEEDDDSFYSY